MLKTRLFGYFAVADSMSLPLRRKLTLTCPDFGKITQNHSITPFNAVQGHSMSPISVAMESPFYATSYV